MQLDDDMATTASVDQDQAPIFSSLLTLRLPISVSLGQRELELKEVLSTGLGSVIPINKEVSEPVELMVHGRVVARGEIVEVNGNYGFRVKHMVSRQELLDLCKS
jgi:flagellar motor switch protein FliN